MANNAWEWNASSSGLGVLDRQPGTAGEDAGDRLAGAGNRVGPIDKLEWHVRPSQQHRFHGHTPLRMANSMASPCDEAPEQRVPWRPIS